jgi:hypothetical protein
VVLGSTSTPGSDPIAQAATLSSNTPGYRMNYAMSITGPNLPAPVTGTGSAIVDLRDRAASVSFAIDFSGEPQIAQVLGSTTMNMRMIVDGGVVYMSLPSVLLRELPGLGGKQWLKISVPKVTGLPGLGSLGSDPTMSDPSQMLEYLRANSSSVTDEGQQQVDGVETTHYRAILDLNNLAANVPASEQAAVRQALSQLEQAAGSEGLPIDVWIDAQHLVRRVAMSLSMHTANGGTIAMNETADLTDYGPQPRPTPPPDGQVQDLTNLIHVAS